MCVYESERVLLCKKMFLWELGGSEWLFGGLVVRFGGVSMADWSTWPTNKAGCSTKSCCKCM